MESRETDLRRFDAAQAAAEVERVVARGEVICRRAEGGALGSNWVTWAEVEGVVSWREWLAPHVTGVGPEAWMAATSTPSETWPPRGRLFVAAAWARALVRVVDGALELPLVLDLRGLPAVHGATTRRFLDHLAGALRQLDRGLVVLVEDQAWVVERCLR